MVWVYVRGSLFFLVDGGDHVRWCWRWDLVRSGRSTAAVTASSGSITRTYFIKISPDGNGGGAIFSLMPSWWRVSVVTVAFSTITGVVVEDLLWESWLSFARLLLETLAVLDVLWLEKKRLMADMKPTVKNERNQRWSTTTAIDSLFRSSLSKKWTNQNVERYFPSLY